VRMRRVIIIPGLPPFAHECIPCSRTSLFASSNDGCAVVGCFLVQSVMAGDTGSSSIPAARRPGPPTHRRSPPAVRIRMRRRSSGATASVSPTKRPTIITIRLGRCSLSTTSFLRSATSGHGHSPVLPCTNRKCRLRRSWRPMSTSRSIRSWASGWSRRTLPRRLQMDWPHIGPPKWNFRMSCVQRSPG